MSTIITKPVLAKPAQLEYSAKGPVVRVFDENGDGDLLPVEFDPLGDGSSFKLRHVPVGRVYAEVPQPA